MRKCLTGSIVRKIEEYCSMLKNLISQLNRSFVVRNLNTSAKVYKVTILAFVCVAVYAGVNARFTPLLAAPDADIDIPLTGAPPLVSVPVVLDLDGDGPQEIVLA